MNMLQTHVASLGRISASAAAVAATVTPATDIRITALSRILSELAAITRELADELDRTQRYPDYRTGDADKAADEETI